MIENRSFYTVTDEPTAELYRAIIAEACHNCDRFSLVQRNELVFDEEATKFFVELHPHLLQERIVSEWPGTQLLGGQAVLREYRLTAATVAILARHVDGLYDWCQPSLPEDLVFWRPSAGPWLVAITHERDAYFDISPRERDELLRAIPALVELLSP